MQLRELTINDKELIKELFRSVFMREPWNDDWSDDAQLDAYITDLVGCPNSLTLAYFDGDEPVALAMGRVKHWYSSTEYYIDELCVRTELQGKGIGGSFVSDIEAYLIEHGVKAIFLLTNRDVPAYDFYKKHGFETHDVIVAFAKHL